MSLASHCIVVCVITVTPYHDMCDNLRASQFNDSVCPAKLSVKQIYVVLLVVFVLNLVQ